MKSLLVTAVSALALGLVLTSIATAQEPQPPDDRAQPAPDALLPSPDDPAPDAIVPTYRHGGAPGKSSPLPVAEAKKRYQATQEQLQNLLKGGETEPLKQYFLRGDRLMTRIEDPRNRLRAPVAEDFDARRQLQQAELAELEGRVARIKRALEIRDAMRDTLIDQRTGELLDQIEEQGDKTGKLHGTILEDPNAAKGSATGPAKRGAALDIQEAEIDIKEAEANLVAAKRAHDYAKGMNVKGFVTSDEVQEKAVNYECAKLKLERAREKLKSLGGTPVDSTSATDNAPAESGAGAATPPAEKDADAIQRDSRLIELDADEAMANLESAERAYKRLQKLHASGAIEQAVLDEQADKLKLAKIQLERTVVKASLDVEEAQANLASAERAFKRAEKLHATGAIEQSALDELLDKYNRAQIELDRAEAKLNALDRSPAGDRPGDEHKKASSAFAPVDPSQIVWGPVDTDAVPARAGEPVASLQLGLIVEPKKAAYTPGDVLTAKLFLRHIGKQRRKVVVPRSCLEKLGIDLVRCDATGERLNWQWGPAHKERARPPNVEMAFEPGAIKQVPSLKLAVARAEMLGGPDGEPTIFAYLDIKPGQTARLSFNVNSDFLRLETAPFEFRVEEPAQQATTGDGPVTAKAPN